jgi:hypothetical protein
LLTNQISSTKATIWASRVAVIFTFCSSSD